MDRLLIRRCTLRLHRRGGWSWGPDPQRLVQTAKRLLPELISRRLAHLFGDQEKSLSVDHLSIRIPVTLLELMELGRQPDATILPSNLLERISERCKPSLSAHAGAVTAADDSPQFGSPDSKQVDAIQDSPAPLAGEDILTLLAKWYQQGHLVRLLRQFGERSLSGWEKLALDELSSVDRTIVVESRWTDATETLSRRVRESTLLTNGGSRRLLLLAALVQRFPKQITRGTMLQLLDQHMAMDGHASESATQQPDVDHSASQADPNIATVTGNDSPKSPPTHGSHRSKARTQDDFELKVSSVLPFVVVGALSRLGYFDVVSTALQAAGLIDDLRGFVVALAYKILPNSQQGWLRQEADQRTAAAVAGLQRCVTGAEIDRFARRCEDCLSPADGFLQLLLAEGHDVSHPMLIHRTTIADRPLWVLLDSQGAFVIGWFLSEEALIHALEDFVGSIVLVTEAAAAPSLFAAVSSRHRFVTSARPVRGDPWRAVDRRRTLWTNDWDSPAKSLLRQSECFRVAAESAERATVAFVSERPALHLEHSLALAAASALGVISWKLWGDREPTDALLAIERLGDLEGRVSIGRQRVTVRPALGRRYQDLKRHGFLVDVANLPWLDGRPMEFAGL